MEDVTFPPAAAGCHVFCADLNSHHMLAGSVGWLRYGFISLFTSLRMPLFYAYGVTATRVPCFAFLNPQNLEVNVDCRTQSGLDRSGGGAHVWMAAGVTVWGNQ